MSALGLPGRNKRYRDFTGETVGRLRILGRADDRFSPGGHREVWWDAVCSCGTRKDVSGQRLRNGQVRSCGCLSRELAQERAIARWFNEYVGYAGAHIRVRSLRGSARSHRCGCGEPAADWAYTHNDPDEMREGNLRYSAKTEFYQPMCKPCHGRYDADFRRSLA